MKVNFSSEEMYPVFEIDGEGLSSEYDVPEDLLREYADALKAFKEVRSRLIDFIDGVEAS